MHDTFEPHFDSETGQTFRIGHFIRDDASGRQGIYIGYLGSDEAAVRWVDGEHGTARFGTFRNLYA